nr:PREDICTED: uncharacterized protein C10orf95-like [Rhinolophus sinicus]
MMLLRRLPPPRRRYRRLRSHPDGNGELETLPAASRSGRAAGRPFPGGARAPREVSFCPPRLTFPGLSAARTEGREFRPDSCFHLFLPFPELRSKPRFPAPSPPAGRGHRPIAAPRAVRPALTSVRPAIGASISVSELHIAATARHAQRGLCGGTAPAPPCLSPLGTAWSPDLYERERAGPCVCWAGAGPVVPDAVLPGAGLRVAAVPAPSRLATPSAAHPPARSREQTASHLSLISVVRPKGPSCHTHVPRTARGTSVSAGQLSLAAHPT